MTTQDPLFGPIDGEITGTAEIPPPGLYRYDLTRSWRAEPRRTLQWIMLNPSTADAERNDVTLTRCIGFAQNLGFDRLVVNNLFALRATNPQALLRSEDPVGADNDKWIERRCKEADMTIVAWGTGPQKNWSAFKERMDAVLSVVENPHCLSLTVDGMPGHPSRLAASSRPTPYIAPARQLEVRTIQLPGRGFSLG